MLLVSCIAAYDYSGDYGYSIVCNGGDFQGEKTRTDDGVYNTGTYWTSDKQGVCKFSYTGDARYFEDGGGPLITPGRNFQPLVGTPVPNVLKSKNCLPTGEGCSACFKTSDNRCIFKVWKKSSMEIVYMAYCSFSEQVACKHACRNGEVTEPHPLPTHRALTGDSARSMPTGMPTATPRTGCRKTPSSACHAPRGRFRRAQACRRANGEPPAMPPKRERAGITHHPSPGMYQRLAKTM